MKYFLLFALVIGIMPAIGAAIGMHNDRVELEAWLAYIDEHECTTVGGHWYKCNLPTPHHVWRE